jgi:hypothetical protein
MGAPLKQTPPRLRALFQDDAPPLYSGDVPILIFDAAFSEKWEYVWMNRVRAGLVKAPEELPYLGADIQD